MGKAQSAPVKEQQTVSKPVKRVLGVIGLFVLAYAGLMLYQNQAHADEPNGDVTVTVNQDSTGPAPVVEEALVVEEKHSSSRFSQAFDLIFKGDSREIVAEANAELEARMLAADAREAAILEREAELAEAEIFTADAKSKAQFQAERTAKAHKALTDCVLTAINPVEEAE